MLHQSFAAYSNSIKIMKRNTRELRDYAKPTEETNL